MIYSFLLLSVTINIIQFNKHRKQEEYIYKLSGKVRQLKNKPIKVKQYSNDPKLNDLINQALSNGTSIVSLRGSNNMKAPQRKVY